MSHPMWVCGLKQASPHTGYVHVQSHPMWVCGLKRYVTSDPKKMLNVTPYVGVWIETIQSSCCLVLPIVTPYVGVWIET